MTPTVEFTIVSKKFEQISADDSLEVASESVELLAKEPSHILAAERVTAINLQNSINSILNTKGKRTELTPTRFKSLYDPTLPTVLFDANHALSGVELLGMANAQNTNRKLNIIYANMVTADVTYQQLDDGSTVGKIVRGQLIDGQGNVVYGEFEEAIRIDAIESVDVELLTQLTSIHFPTLSHPDRLRQYNDKHTLEAIGEEVGLVVPRRFALEDLTEDDDIVIKPSNASQGRGVYFGTHHNRSVEDWRRYYKYLEEKGYDPVIEERVECWPIFDPETGKKLDWNVRALVSSGTYSDMYIRAGAEASAVNKTTGAKSIHLNNLEEYLGSDAPVSARLIRSTLHDAANAFAEAAGDFIVGIDLTINTYGEVVLFEANAGHVGGLQTIASLTEGTTRSRLKTANRMIDGLAATVKIREGMHLNAEDISLPYTLHMKADFIDQTRMEHLMTGKDFLNAHNEDETESFTRIKLLLTQLHNSRMEQSNNDVKDEIIHEMMRWPLEAIYFLPGIPLSLGSQALRDSLTELVQVDPWLRESKLSAIFTAAQDSDMRAVYDLIKSCDDREKDVLRQARRAMQHIVDANLSELNLTDAEYIKLQSLFDAHTNILLILGIEHKSLDVINDAFIEVCEKYIPKTKSLSALSRMIALMGNYELAEKYLQQVDMNDDSVIDYHLDTLNLHQKVLLKTEEGRAFIARNYMGLGGHGLLIYYKEQGGDLSAETQRLIEDYDLFFNEED